MGIEPTHKGFADLSLTTWVPRLNLTSIAKTQRPCQCLLPHVCKVRVIRVIGKINAVDSLRPRTKRDFSTPVRQRQPNLRSK